MYVGVGVNGVGVEVGAPSTLSMSDFSLVGHWQFMCVQLHCMS